MTKTKIYLACPYTHIDPKVRQKRFEQVNEVAGQLMKKGYIVFSPISHSHPISLTLNNSVDADFWLDQDKHFIDWCDELHILCLDGWQQSKGVSAEIKLAKKLNKRIVKCKRLN